MAVLFPTLHLNDPKYNWSGDFKLLAPTKSNPINDNTKYNIDGVHNCKISNLLRLRLGIIQYKYIIIHQHVP
jgi:hypothetical protein